MVQTLFGYAAALGLGVSIVQTLLLGVDRSRLFLRTECGSYSRNVYQIGGGKFSWYFPNVYSSNGL